MYFDKEDAIEMIANAKEAIERIKNHITTDMDTHRSNCDATFNLENSIEKLEKAVENCSYLVRNAEGNLV